MYKLFLYKLLKFYPDLMKCFRLILPMGARTHTLVFAEEGRSPVCVMEQSSRTEELSVARLIRNAPKLHFCKTQMLTHTH